LKGGEEHHILNGTMTVVIEEGLIEEMPAYITFQSNSISIFFDPEATDDYFVPTPITGLIILRTSEICSKMSVLLSSTA
jgi:hypothetical protein